MTVIRSMILVAALAAAAGSLAASAAAPGTLRATVVGVHPQEWSAGYERIYGLTPGNSGAGRFAVARLVDPVSARDVYLLVRVPSRLTLRKNSLVEIEADAVDLERHPGTASVTRLVLD